VLNAGHAHPASVDGTPIARDSDHDAGAVAAVNGIEYRVQQGPDG
jgi:hypothetical protein